MKTLTVKEFCDKHDACEGGREWALKKCSTMQEAWDKAQPNWVAWIATRKGVLTHKELILFAVFCARQNEHLLTDQRSKDAITIAEKFANGEATQEESARAARAAACAASAAACAARAASDASAAAWAARAAASAAASAAAWAASAAAWAASAASDARAAASDARAAAWAASAAIQKKQAEYLQRFTFPNFMP